MHLKDADKMADNVDLDQTAPVCPNLESLWLVTQTTQLGK